ncbi:hypothetical protein [Nocardia callitridis]
MREDVTRAESDFGRRLAEGAEGATAAARAELVGGIGQFGRNIETGRVD